MKRYLFPVIGVLTLFGLALQSGAGTIIYHEDFSHFEGKSEMLRVVEAGHPEFSHALELRSIKKKDGTIRQGSWQLPLRKTDKIPQSSIMEISFWMKAATESARYALLVNDNSHKAITVVQDNGFFKVAKSPDGGWERAAAIKIGQWHKVLYRLDFSRGVFDVFVDDMVKPAVQHMLFRDSETLFANQISTLGSPSAESRTLFGPITVSLTFPKEFPAESFNTAPHYLKGVSWTTPAPGPEAFGQSVPLALETSAGAAKEGATLSLLRDQKNLYCLFRLKAQDMKKRVGQASTRDGEVLADDCFELFVRPDLQQEGYYHLAGNSFGALYDAKCPQPGLPDAAWNCRWTSQISKDEHGWTALVTIPFAELGCSSPKNTLWGFAAGRKNPHTKEVLSWTSPESFGKLYLAAEHDTRDAKLRVSELMDAYYDLPQRFKSLAEKVQGELPFPHRILSEIQQQLGDKLKALIQHRGEASSFQEFARVDANLSQLTAETAELLQKSHQMGALFKPGSEGHRRAYLACVESSMTKVLVRNVLDSYSDNPLTRASLLLSGDEYGSFQVVLLPITGKEFKGVKIAIPSLTDQAGNALEKARMSVFLVESVRTAMVKKEPAYYPDVLKPGTEFNVENRALVPLWFDIYLPPDTPAGIYQTQINIYPEDSEACVVPVTIEATGLTLPLGASLDTAFCFVEPWVREFYGAKTPPEKMRDYCKFILDHRLEPMNLWSGSDIDIGADCLDYSAQLGKTMLFLNISNPLEKQGKYRELIKKYQGKLRPIFFGHDEVHGQNSPEKLANMQRDFKAAKELFPEVSRLNTAPVDERLFGYVDIWCPLFGAFNADDSAERIKLGEEVWWYPTGYPLAPYANFNLDSPGIDPRVIPWMNWKLNISGLLYWALNREWLTNTPEEVKRISPAFAKQRSIDWLTPDVTNKIISSGSRWPEQPWLPYFRSVKSDKVTSATNGAGNLLYPGPDWEPWPSTRLKNLRDGMQDYEYFVMLKNNLEALRVKLPDHPMIPLAQKALAIDNEVVGGATLYTKDPEQLLAFRAELIRLVQETAKILQ